MSEERKNQGFGFNGKTILTILAIISLVPYRYLPKILQDLKNVLESVNPLKRLHDWITEMDGAEALHKLQPGDHIYCYRDKFYSHHGIYAGNGKVWEYDGKTIADAEIKLSSLHDFSLGDAINCFDLALMKRALLEKMNIDPNDDPEIYFVDRSKNWRISWVKMGRC